MNGEIPGLISVLVLGLVLGYLARLIVPGKQKLGCLSTLALGAIAAIGGALLLSTDVVSLPVVFLLQLGIAVLLVAVVGGVRRRG